MMLCMHWVLTILLGLGCADGTDVQPSPNIEPAEQTRQTEDTHVPTPAPDTGEEDPDGDCDLPAGFDWSSWGQPFFRTWCAGCHGANAPERHGAPDWLVFDTEAQVYAHRERIQSSVLERGSMPLGGGLPEQEAASLALFLRCVFGP